MSCNKLENTKSDLIRKYKKCLKQQKSTRLVFDLFLTKLTLKQQKLKLSLPIHPNLTLPNLNLPNLILNSTFLNTFSI